MFCPPPADLNDRDPLVDTVSSGTLWFRSHATSKDPIFYGRAATHRWDAPDGSYGVLYLACDEYCAFMESIGRGVLKTRFVPRVMLQTRQVSKLRLLRPLRLIDLAASGGLARVGAEGTLTTGSGYRNSQRWSQALRNHPAQPDGLYYRSRYDPARTAVALYDDCRPIIELAEDCGTWAAQPALLGAILDHYRLGTDL
jgi:hypothetical protein